MQQNKRTLTNLLDLDRLVYLYFANTAVFDIFKKQATKEGFLWADKKKVTKKHYTDIAAMNNDMTFHYVGFCGHMRFNIDDQGIYRIDFAKYINGAENYDYTEESDDFSQTN